MEFSPLSFLLLAVAVSAGCEFGINVWGWSGTSYCPDAAQIEHFVNHGANIIRIPFGWQYMVTDQSSTTLVDSYFQQYDKLVKAATAKGAYVILDLHNYGRWNSGVVGVDFPSNADFARLWSLLATKYANNPLVMYGLMNKPHDQDISKFAVSCQEAVNAICAAGAKSQAIILPGDSWNNAAVWASGANAPMLEITGPTATDKSALLLDVHQYIDRGGSGTSHTCTDHGLDMLEPLVTNLHKTGRRAIITEIGAGVTDSCLTYYFPQVMQYVVDNSDVIAGFTVWSAGSFQPYPNYALSIVPNADGSDNIMFVKAVKPFLPGVETSATSSIPVQSLTTNSEASTLSTVPVATSSAVLAVASSGVLAKTSSTVPVVTSSVAPVFSSFVAPAVPPVEISSAAPAGTSSATSVVISSMAHIETYDPVETSSAAPVFQSPATVISSEAAITPTSAASWAKPPAVFDSVTMSSTENLQPFSEALGGFSAPAITKSGNFWYIEEQRYSFLIDALNHSCYKQMDMCQLHANRSGNMEPFTVQNCNGIQIQACLNSARAAVVQT